MYTWQKSFATRIFNFLLDELQLKSHQDEKETILHRYDIKLKTVIYGWLLRTFIKQ